MKAIPTQNTEIQTLVELSALKYNEILNENTVEHILGMLHDDEHELTNLDEHRLIIDSLKNDRDIYKNVIYYAIKMVITSTLKELPLLVLVNQLAETLIGRRYTNRMRIGAVIVKLLQNTGLFGLVMKFNQHSHRERIVVCKYNLSKLAVADLSIKIRNLPTETPVKATSKVAGHKKKRSGSNGHMLWITDKLNQVGYTIDERVWNKYSYELAAYRFDDMDTQNAMVTEGNRLLGNMFYFGHRFGPDNGRIYCDGDLFTLQGGALNFIYKFADKRMLSEAGLGHLRARVAELAAEHSLSFKEQVEFYSLSLDLIDAEHGKPVGTILHIDAKLSGLQHQCIATRTKSEALYCGLLNVLEDGYGHIRNNLSNADVLSRDMVKKAYNPYQYGAGGKTVVAAVQDAGGSLDFKEWEVAYQTSFPKAFALREFLLSIAMNYKADIHEYTSPSGYNCVITALGTEADNVVTCYGKLKYERKEVNSKYMGVKLVAAFSHMLDASLVHYVVGHSNFDITVVHDSFGVHPNDIDKVHDLYTMGMRENLARPVLEDFVSSIVGPQLARVNVSRLMTNTLTPNDIVGGLY